MPKKDFAKTLSDARVMAAGIRNNVEALTRRGLTAQTADDIDEKASLIEAKNNEQEAIKAQQKVKTKEINDELKALNKLTSENSKIIKLEIPQTKWIEFGITAKR